MSTGQPTPKGADITKKPNFGEKTAGAKKAAKKGSAKKGSKKR